MREAVLWFGTGHMQMCSRFQKVFERKLEDFWIDNVKGLDIAKFDKEVVCSGSHSVLAAVKLRWGREGVTVLKRLLPKRFVNRKRPA